MKAIGEFLSGFLGLITGVLAVITMILFLIVGAVIALVGFVVAFPFILANLVIRKIFFLTRKKTVSVNWDMIQKELGKAGLGVTRKKR